MDERIVQFRVGAFFLSALLLAGILLFMFGKLPTVRHYQIKARFSDVGGITAEAPVRINGVLVGRVKDIRLTDNDESVMLTLDIDSDKVIYDNETPYITHEIMGSAAVVFIPSAIRGGPRKPLEAGAVVPGKYSNDPTGLMRELQAPISTVSDAAKAFTGASKQLNAASRRIEDILNEKAQQDISSILADTAKSLKVIRKVLGDENNQTKLADALGKLPDTLDNMNRTFGATQNMLRKLTEGPEGQTAVDRMVDAIKMTQRTLQQFSEPSESGQPAPVEQIAKAMANINEISDLMKDIMSRIDKGEGSLGALLNDQQLYQRLNRAARNMEQVSREIRPIVEDAGVFMDKAARHPGSILRDAVKPGAGIK